MRGRDCWARCRTRFRRRPQAVSPVVLFSPEAARAVPRVCGNYSRQTPAESFRWYSPAGADGVRDTRRCRRVGATGTRRKSDIILAQVKSILMLFSMAMLAADQQGWSPREGALLKYRVNLRFGEELVSPSPAPNQA